ncbi:MAG: hypothetical protein HETSPECPRED_009360 [Heterodermia speciosa]|uniref:Uncharacterized protein n=1 Tax=Heterodermia speciosa TaxID=116794 RepID=A0A8H3G2W7_9LECA|nr:MAG: hypothetical protein HETSPECPRED_009360 [Heterodermia speciosa]
MRALAFVVNTLLAISPTRLAVISLLQTSIAKHSTSVATRQEKTGRPLVSTGSEESLGYQKNTTGQLYHKEWPAAPFVRKLPGGNHQWSLHFQEVKKLRPDWDAYYALREACFSMESWIRTFRPLHEPCIYHSHDVMKVFRSSDRAMLSLRPLPVSAAHDVLNRVLAEYAIQAFTKMIDVYGIGEFRFELCEGDTPLGEVTNYFF